MINIRALCDQCGQVTLGLPQIELIIREDDVKSFYSFRCPRCGVLCGGPADNRLVHFLIASGVKPKIGSLSTEIFERKSGPPLTYDDLIDFHLLLDSDDWFDRLRNSLGPRPRK